MGSLFIAKAGYRRCTSGGSAPGDDQAVLYVRPYGSGGGERYRCHYRIKGRDLFLGLSLLLTNAEAVLRLRASRAPLGQRYPKDRISDPVSVFDQAQPCRLFHLPLDDFRPGILIPAHRPLAMFLL
jgi:hypothetical protein